MIDASGGVSVSGPTKRGAGSKDYTIKVTNQGTGPLTLNLGSAISGSVRVGGVATGTVTGPTGTSTIGPGRSTRYKLVWTHGALSSGAAVVYSGCVTVTGDMDPPDNCGSATATAK